MIQDINYGNPVFTVQQDIPAVQAPAPPAFSEGSKAASHTGPSCVAVFDYQACTYSLTIIFVQALPRADFLCYD